MDFLKNQTLGNAYAEDIEEKIKSMGSGAAGKGGVGMLQRVLKIGFNRAARIMDQLCEYGVVGEEEGTKPRKILMSPEQFERLIEEML